MTQTLITRRRLAGHLGAAALACTGLMAVAAPAHAAYPEQPIKLLVGFPPRGRR